MNPIVEWLTAQRGEKTFWDGVSNLDYFILRVMADNSVHAPVVRKYLSPFPNTCLEVGIGPLSLGISAFLPEIPNRFGLDPLPRVSTNSTVEQPKGSTEELRSYIQALRGSIRYVQACGEEIPIRSESMDFVICSNVLDHSSDPDAILREIRRILRPSGRLYLGVDTFSLLGLLKWHVWTKYAHKHETLVTAHPYRLLETNAERRLLSAGFHLQKIQGHTFISRLAGHAHYTVFLATR